MKKKTNKSIYLNTTGDITIGLLDTCKFKWLTKKTFIKKKGASSFHYYLYSILEEYNLDLKKDIDNVIICSGPGSYTGMRISEGPASILEWENINICSFYSFEVPKMSGIITGYFITNAFKGEYFLYEWNNKQEKKRLVSLEYLEKNIFTQKKNFSDINEINSVDLINVNRLIDLKTKEIFTKVLDRDEHLDIYYFRTIENEFVLKK